MEEGRGERLTETTRGGKNKELLGTLLERAESRAQSPKGLWIPPCKRGVERMSVSGEDKFCNGEKWRWRRNAIRTPSTEFSLVEDKP